MRGQALRLILQVFGVALVLSGGLWTLQGAGIIAWPENSFMLGESAWVIRGAATFALGAVLLWQSERMRR